MRQRLINLHPAAPAIIHQWRIRLVLPRDRVIQHLPDPWPQHIPRAIQAARKPTYKNRGRGKSLSRLEPASKRPGIGVQPRGAGDCSRIACHTDARAPAELNAHIPAIVRSIVAFHQRPRNNLAFVLIARVGARPARPLVSRRRAHFVGAHIRRSPRAFLYVGMVEWAIRSKAKAKAVLHRDPYFRCRQIFNADGMFDGSRGHPRLPTPVQTQLRRTALIDEGHAFRTHLAGRGIKLPMQRNSLAILLNRRNQLLGSLVDPRCRRPGSQAYQPWRRAPRIEPQYRLFRSYRRRGLRGCRNAKK